MKQEYAQASIRWAQKSMHIARALQAAATEARLQEKAGRLRSKLQEEVTAARWQVGENGW